MVLKNLRKIMKVKGPNIYEALNILSRKVRLHKVSKQMQSLIKTPPIYLNDKGKELCVKMLELKKFNMRSQ